MQDRLFKALYLGGLVAEILVRIPIDRQRRQIAKIDQRVSDAERGLLGLLSLGILFIPLIYCFTPWLRFADYRWPASAKARAGSIGAALLAAALWLFWRSHHDLGANWSPSLEINDRQTLVTRGVYRTIRHPMYASQWLWNIAQTLLLHNWVAGFAGLAAFLPLYLVRTPREEQMMTEHFGDAYRAYSTRTGRVVPRLRG
jgi:protein-S-isoprenylcysteine O-methyltransferase Ste14